MHRQTKIQRTANKRFPKAGDGFYDTFVLGETFFFQFEGGNNASVNMAIGHQVLLVLGIIQILLLVTSLFVIGLNKEMSTIGRIFRAILIVMFPLLGPLLVILEVLRWRVKREEEAKRASATD